MALESSQLHSRRLSDTELLHTEFRIHDPENIEGLNRGVPDPEAHPAIIGYYDVTPPGGRAKNPNFPFIRCCHCGLRRHWRGHVVRDDRDQLYIIGARQCGRQHYGAKYDAAEKAFRDEQARKRALLRWRNMAQLVAEMDAEVDALLHSKALAALELKRDEIRRASPAGLRRLLQEEGTGQPLFEIMDERDHAAEAERQRRYERALATFQAKPSAERRELRDAGLKPELETSPIYVRTTTPLGPLMGAGFLTDRGDVRAAALALRDTLRSVAAIDARGTQNTWLSELERVLREMTDRPRTVREAIHEVVFAPLFFSPDNLERMQRWSASHPRCSYHQHEGALVVQDSSHGRSEIAPLARANLPSTPVISSEYRDDEFLPILAEVA